MKCTRYHYMKEVEKFLCNEEYKNDSVLEISGKTNEWLKYFKIHTIANYPEIDAHKLPYDNESFDAVICNQVLEHVKKPWICVNEFYRVLKSDGILILSSPFIYQEHNHPIDNWRFTPNGLKILCEEFSEILMTHKAGNTKMLEHMLKYPNDRNSDQFKSLLNYEDDKKNYYSISTLIAKK